MSGRRAAGSGAILKWKRRNPKTGRLEQVGWLAVADLGIIDGKRVRQKVYGHTQAEVQEGLTEILHKKQRGTLPRPGRLTVADFLAKWLHDRTSGPKELKPRTLEHYELIIRRHIAPAIGTKPLAKLTPSDVEAMLGAQIKAGRAPRSVAHVRAVLRNALERADRDQLVSRNVARQADGPTVDDEERPALEPEQAAEFLRAIVVERLSAMYVVTLGLGLRLGELSGLRWSDVDLDAGVLRIRKALQWLRPVGGGASQAYLLDPKSKKSKRTFDLSEPVVEALRRHRTQWLEEKIRLGEKWLNAWDLVFTGPQGEPLRPRTVRDEFQAILVRAELPHMHLHDLRHSNASLLLAAGVSMKMLSELMGHSDPAFTAKTYAHVLKKSRAAAKVAQAGIFGG